jgi:hypothetical protein
MERRGSGAGGGLGGGGAGAQGGVHLLDIGSESEQDDDELMRVLCPDEEGEQQGKGNRQKAAIGGEVGVTEGDDLVKAQSRFLSVFGL